MSAFEVIQEWEHLNASGIVCIESVYEFKETWNGVSRNPQNFSAKVAFCELYFCGKLS